MGGEAEEDRKLPVSLKLLSQEERKVIEDDLCSTWQALASLRRSAVPTQARQEHRAELSTVVRRMAMVPPAPPAAATCSPQDFLPNDVRQTMAVAVAVQSGRGLWTPFFGG